MVCALAGAPDAAQFPRPCQGAHIPGGSYPGAALRSPPATIPRPCRGEKLRPKKVVGKDQPTRGEGKQQPLTLPSPTRLIFTHIFVRNLLAPEGPGMVAGGKPA